MSERSQELLKWASMIAAGAITEDQVSKILDDDDLMSQVLVLVAGIGAGTVVAVAYDTARDTPVVGDTMEIAEDIIDLGLDMFGF